MNKLMLAIGFLIGNFVWQYFGAAPNYELAMERTYFQAIAMIFIVWAPAFLNKGK